MSLGTSTFREWAVVLLGLALPISIAGGNIGWGLVLAATGYGAARGTPLRWRDAVSAPLAPLALCLGSALVAAALAPSFSWAALKGDAHRLWFAAVVGLGLAGLSREARLQGLGAFAVGGAIGAATGITTVTLAFLAADRWGRAHSFVHPVTYGELQCLAGLALAASLAAPREKPPGAAFRRVAWPLLALVFVALVLSGTRGAVLGFLGGLLAIAAARPALRRAILVLLPVGVLAFAAADLIPQQGGRSVLAELSGAEGGQSYRLQLWSAGWRMFLARPTTGVGPGNYRLEYERLPDARRDQEGSYGNAHNLFVHHLAERGLVGLAATLLLFGVLWACARRAGRDPSALSLAALGATAGFTIMNLTEVALQTEQVSMAFFFLWLLHAKGPDA